MDKQTFVNKVNLISDLAEVWDANIPVHMASRVKPIQTVCKELLKEVGSDGLEFVFQREKEIIYQMKEVFIDEIKKPRKDVFTAFNEWHKKYYGKPSALPDKMNAFVKKEYDIFKAGYDV
jgi:hypothetical protein